MSFHVPEKDRLLHGPLQSTDADGNNGAFIVSFESYEFRCIASDGMGWEHVSVSMPSGKTPSWKQMCAIKRIFWDAEDCVVQYHPPESQYVNVHDGCLHLWRPVGGGFPLPVKEMVG